MTDDSTTVSLTKQVAEKLDIAFDYTNCAAVLAGATVSSGTISAVDLTDGSDVSATLLDNTTATISGAEAQGVVIAGTHGRDYLIHFLTVLSTSREYRDSIRVRVRNKTS